MPPKKVARKVTQQPTEEPKRRKTEKNGRKREKKKGKEVVKASLRTAPTTLTGAQIVTMDTDEHTEVEEPAISSAQSSLINGEQDSLRLKSSGRGKKRKILDLDVSTCSTVNQTLNSSAGSSTTRRVKKFHLSVESFLPIEKGDRVLSCGEGEQLGHPGRSTTRKPRAISTLPEEKLIVQVIAGGVHSLVLMEDGTVYGCGINEKGTVPGEGIEPEESSDKLTPIKFSDSLIQRHGKVVMLAAGASFSAALTEKGSVIAWGNLRGMSGCIESHETLLEMEKQPVVIVQHQQKVIVKIAAGENHLVMLTENGEVLTFGDGSVGQLGRCSRVSHIRSQRMVNDSPDSLRISVYDKGKKKLVLFDNIMAGGFWTAARSIDGTVYVCGLNNFGQLGVPTPEAPEDEGSQPELKIMHPVKASAFGSTAVVELSGIQHIVALNAQGEVYGIGKNTDNALGLGTWNGKEDDHWKYSELQKIDIPEQVKGISASLGCSIVWTDNGNAYSWGYDSSGQLGLGIKDDEEKMVSRPRKITSAHLDGYRIVGASLADNHALFLAKKL
ncbi:CBR-RAN-3 protein [Loa loa]|uniref:CBR-RAN-3 protein n=1 Tax=Loa loa TaxID=7209 RepID=A0A1I7VH84_LOALO|nr:CBR-RAN-3 protein [Loa loa]EJD73936.1 CBR-RAN-3 protein [Loa loa]